jgi:hypothetical protein
MIGAFAGDGFVVNGRIIGFTKCEDAVREQFTRAMTQYNEHPVQARSVIETPQDNKFGPSHSVIYSSVASELRDMFVNDCYDHPADPAGRAALRKRLPHWIFGMTLEARLGLLAGLLDTDGSVYVSHKNSSSRSPKTTVLYSTSSPGLRDDIRFLCYSLGIRCTYYVTSPSPGRRPQKNDSFTLSFSLPDIQRVAGQIRLATADRQTLLDQLAQSEPLWDRLDIVPPPLAVIPHTSDARGIFAPDPQLLRTLRTLRNKNREAWSCERALARRILPFLPDTAEFRSWRQLVEADQIHWDRIKSVTPAGKATVYTLTVPATKVFAINHGLIISTTP